MKNPKRIELGLKNAREKWGISLNGRSTYGVCKITIRENEKDTPFTAKGTTNVEALLKCLEKVIEANKV